LLAEATLNQLHVAHVKIPKTCFFHLIKFKQDKKKGVNPTRKVSFSVIINCLDVILMLSKCDKLIEI